MRLIDNGTKVETVTSLRIGLSERNLKALLVKLQQDGSMCTITKWVTPTLQIILTSEFDDEHYRKLREATGQTIPGPMSPETEAAMEEVS